MPVTDQQRDPKAEALADLYFDERFGGRTVEVRLADLLVALYALQTEAPDTMRTEELGKICGNCRQPVGWDDSCACTARAGSPVTRDSTPAPPRRLASVEPLTDDEIRLADQFGLTHNEYRRVKAQAAIAWAMSRKMDESTPEPATGMRITSDGTGPGTKVTFNGKEIQNVKSLTWQVYADDMAHVTLEVIGVPVTVNAVVPPEVTMRCATCDDLVGEHTCGAVTA